MSKIIRQGFDKDLLCKIGLHKWTRWRVIAFAMSHVNDLEKRCLKCEMVRRRTVAR